MLNRQIKKNITWISLINPTSDEVAQIQNEFLIHDDVADDILSPTIRPACIEYENYVYIVQHFPRLSLTKDDNRRHEIDFIIGDHWIITINYDDVSHLIDIPEIIEEAVNEQHLEDTDAGYIYLEILNSMYTKCNKRLDGIDEELDKIEANIYNGQEKQMVKSISIEMRKLIDFEHALTMHDKILEDMEDWGTVKYNDSFERHIGHIQNELDEIESRLLFLKSAVKQFQDTNDSLLEHKTADAMKTLTMMSFVVFPLSLLAGIFGMNVSGMPFVNDTFGFFEVIMLMFLITFVFFIFFKYKKWL